MIIQTQFKLLHHHHRNRYRYRHLYAQNKTL